MRWPTTAIPLEHRNQPQPRDEQPTITEQPASRTRFYRDKRNGKLFGVCAGHRRLHRLRRRLVRVCFLAAMFMSGGGVLPFYFIAAMVTPTKPRVARRGRQRGTAVLAGRPRLAGPRRPRYPLAVQGHRPPARRHRKLCDHGKPLARARDRAAALASTRERVSDGAG